MCNLSHCWRVNMVSLVSWAVEVIKDTEECFTKKHCNLFQIWFLILSRTASQSKIYFFLKYFPTHQLPARAEGCVALAGKAQPQHQFAWRTQLCSVPVPQAAVAQEGPFPSPSRRIQGFISLATGRGWVLQQGGSCTSLSGWRRHSWEGMLSAKAKVATSAPLYFSFTPSPPCRLQWEVTMGTKGISCLGPNKQAGGQQVQKADLYIKKTNNLERSTVRPPHQRSLTLYCYSNWYTFFFFSCFLIYLINQSICFQTKYAK